MTLLSFSADRHGEAVLTIWIAAVGVLVTGLIGCLAGLFTPWILLLAGAAGGGTVFAALWYPPRYAAALRGSFDGTAVRAEKGVFWKREVYIPTTALRTVETGATPLQRRLHSRTVVLRFAGGAVLLSLLPEEEAERLSRALEIASAGGAKNGESVPETLPSEES